MFQKIKTLQSLATLAEQACLIQDLDILVEQTVIEEYRLRALMKLYCAKKEDHCLRDVVKEKLQSNEYFDLFIKELIFDIQLLAANPAHVPMVYTTLNGILAILGSGNHSKVAKFLLGDLYSLIPAVRAGNIKNIKYLIIERLIVHAKDLIDVEFKHVLYPLLDFIRPPLKYIISTDKSLTSRQLQTKFKVLKAQCTGNKEELEQALASLERFKKMLNRSVNQTRSDKNRIKREFILLSQACILKFLGKYTQAEQKLLSIKNAQGIFLSLLNLERVFLLKKQKRYKEAVALLDEHLEVQELDTVKAQFYFNRGLINLLIDKVQARKDFEDAYKYVPCLHAEYYRESIELHLADLYQIEAPERFLEKSIELYERILKEIINRKVEGRVYLGLARVYFQKDEREKVSEYLQKALKLEEFEDICTIARAMQGYLLFQDEANRAQAWENLLPIEDSLELLEESWRVLISDALLHYYVHTFNFEKACSFSRKALKICGEQLEKAEHFSFNRALLHFKRGEAQQGVERLSDLVKGSTIKSVCEDIKMHLDALRVEPAPFDKKYGALLSMVPCLLHKRFGQERDVILSLKRWREFSKFTIVAKENEEKNKRNSDPKTLEDFNSHLKRHTHRIWALEKIREGVKLPEDTFIKLVTICSPALMV